MPNISSLHEWNSIIAAHPQITAVVTFFLGVVGKELGLDVYKFIKKTGIFILTTIWAILKVIAKNFRLFYVDVVSESKTMSKPDKDSTAKWSSLE